MADHSPAPGEGGRRALPEEPPPIMGSWRRLYFLVVAWLVVLIAAFYLFARSFKP
jgi:hypothetical protein